MSVSLIVDGNPAGCKAAAADVRILAARVEGASDLLASTMTSACSAWTGHSSDEFTAFAKERLHRADELHEELLLFMLVLESFAHGLADVKSEMKRARGIAARHGIPVTTALPEVGEVHLNPGQEGPLDHALGVANRAREHETRLQRGLQEGLDRVMGLVWEPIDFSSVGKSVSTSGPLDKLGDLVPDLSRVRPSLPDVDLSGTLQGMLELAQDARPNPISIGDHKITVSPSYLNGVPYALLSTIKTTKRLFPDKADEIDKGIRVLVKHGSPTAATIACAYLGVRKSLLPICSKAGEITSGPLADKVVEATDAK